MTEAYKLGTCAFEFVDDEEDCPFKSSTEDYRNWMLVYFDALYEDLVSPGRPASQYSYQARNGKNK